VIRVPRPQTMHQHKRGARGENLRRALVEVKDLDALVESWKVDAPQHGRMAVGGGVDERETTRDGPMRVPSLVRSPRGVRRARSAGSLLHLAGRAHFQLAATASTCRRSRQWPCRWERRLRLRSRSAAEPSQSESVRRWPWR
jgi:hypothetical protein